MSTWIEVSMWNQIKTKLWVGLVGLSIIATAYAAEGNYLRSVANTLVSEGGALYTNHKADPGGPTKYGITIHDVRKYLNPAAQAADVKALTEPQARAIYKAHYWDAVDGDTLAAGMDYVVFDYAVNAGTGRAIPARNACVAAYTEVSAQINCVTNKRMAFQMGLPARYNVFKKGWKRRIISVNTIGLAMAREVETGLLDRDIFLVPRVGLGKAYNPEEQE